MSNTLKSILIVLFILVIDQVVKILVKTNMTLYEQFPVFGDWFRIHFVENRGMAFGLNLPGDYGKILLSLFRIIAVVAITFYLRHLIRLKAHTGLIITLSMIMAGALGNILDSAFYGLIFTESTPSQVAQMFPEGKGYTTFLHGNVVDMFYFPIFSGNYPEWFPRVGGESFIFFRPVFNIADASISVAVFVLLFNQRRFFRHLDEKHDQKKEGEGQEQTEQGTEPGSVSDSEPNVKSKAEPDIEPDIKPGPKPGPESGNGLRNDEAS